METAESNNARLTGRIELEPVPAVHLDTCPMCLGIGSHAIECPCALIVQASSHSEQKTARTNPRRENRETVNKTGVGYSRRNLKMKLARELMSDMERTEDIATRLEQARLIKELIGGRTPKPKEKPAVFA